MSLKKLLHGNTGGKTLLEKMLNRKSKDSGFAGLPYNPLHLALNDLVEMRFEEAGTYRVVKMMTLTAHFEESRYQTARYFLQDTVASEDVETLMLEIVQTEKSEDTENFLFHVLDEFSFEEEFLELLDDEIFIISEETDTGEELEKEYEKTYHAHAKIAVCRDDAQHIQNNTVESWNYELEDELETLYLSIEMNAADGWISMYEGRKLLEGEFEVYQLSPDQASENAS